MPSLGIPERAWHATISRMPNPTHDNPLILLVWWKNLHPPPTVVDTLRPHIPELWQRLSPPDKRLFLRHVARYWEVHRHCVPPATARRIDQLRSAGRLSVLHGRVIAVSDKPTGLCVRIEQGTRVAEVTAGWLINATGPAADVTATTDPLLRGLLDSGLARPDSLRLGIEADAGGALLDVSGTPSDSIFTLGPPLRGQLYETTAIPEIRDQAAALAGRLLAACRARAIPLAASGIAGSARLSGIAAVRLAARAT